MKKVTVHAPVGGKCLDIVDVNDQNFASKILGDGFAIVPNETVVCAPCDGQVVVLPSNKHVFGIKTANGEVLVHIGLVHIEDEQQFSVLIDLNTEVKAGDAIIRFNEKLIGNADATTTVVFIPSKANANLPKQKLLQDVEVGDEILEF